MFNPKYTITAKLLANIKHITTLTEELNSKSFPRIIFAEMESSARALSAFSSTSIEGNPLPLTEVKKLLKKAPEHARDTEKEVLNYNKALEYLHGLHATSHVQITTNLICRIHSLVTEGIMNPSHQGKFRSEPVFVNDPRTRKSIYLPPDHTDVLSLIDDLVSFTMVQEKNIDSLIIAGIFHRQFVIIHPFVDGNGRTARLVTKVLLAHMGINTFNLFSFENYYNKNVSNYFGAVGLRGNYYELLESDFTEWLEYFTDGIIDELLRVKKELEKNSRLPDIGMPPEYDLVMEYIQKEGSINTRMYSNISPRAKATRALDFKKLIELGMIERKGKGKNTYYVKKSHI